MTGRKKKPVTDEQLGKYARRMHDIQGRLVKGAIDFNVLMLALQGIAEGKKVQFVEDAKPRVARPASILNRLRRVDGLFVIGPRELDAACRNPKLENPNPLGLEDGWIPDVPVPQEYVDWILGGVWRDDPEWRTRLALVLTPPALGTIDGQIAINNLFNLQRIWGVPHDGIAGGSVRQNVLWSNWFVVDTNARCLAIQPVIYNWQWQLVYECPKWSMRKNYTAQKAEATQRGMDILAASQDAFVLCAMRANSSTDFRTTNWSRTGTEYDDGLLSTGADSNGVSIDWDWDRGRACGYVGLSVSGVPKS